MYCRSGCLEGLELKDFRYFMINNKASIERHFLHIRYNKNSFAQKYSTCELSLETLKYTLNTKTSIEKSLITFLIFCFSKTAETVCFF